MYKANRKVRLVFLPCMMKPFCLLPGALLLASCASSIGHWMHWQPKFVHGHKQAVLTAPLAREAALAYLKQDTTRYLLDSMRVRADKNIWVISIPHRRGGIPGHSVMGIKSKSGRVGWLPLK
jgi:hypothetical protein